MPRRALHTYRYCYDDDYDGLVWTEIGFVCDEDEASFNDHIVLCLGVEASGEDEWRSVAEAAVRDAASVALNAVGDDARFQLLRLEASAFLIFSFSGVDAVAKFRAHGGPFTREMLFSAPEQAGKRDR
jgi:hypothetical protein